MADLLDYLSKMRLKEEIDKAQTIDELKEHMKTIVDCLPEYEQED